MNNLELDGCPVCKFDGDADPNELYEKEAELAEVTNHLLSLYHRTEALLELTERMAVSLHECMNELAEMNGRPLPYPEQQELH